MAACVLLSGDEGLRVGVQQAQEYRIRVHLLGIRPSRGSQSVFLREEADSVDVRRALYVLHVQSAPAWTSSHCRSNGSNATFSGSAARTTY